MRAPRRPGVLQRPGRRGDRVPQPTHQRADPADDDLVAGLALDELRPQEEAGLDAERAVGVRADGLRRDGLGRQRGGHEQEQQQTHR